jgi:hypothetical protein
VVIVLTLLEAFYLAASNAILRSGLVKKAVESAQGVRLVYASAFSLLPGRVHVRSLVLRFEDYNVQFELAIERARVDIDLLALVHRRFHVHSTETKGTSFKFRHKVHAVGNNGPRLAAHPPIAGFSDPPLYRGKPSPPIPDEHYRLWEVRVENVTASIRELWMLEYRFRGSAVAHGSFTLRPQRWLQVLPGELTIRDGQLTAGPHTVGKSIKGRIRCAIPGLDVRAASGMQVFKGISADVALELQGGGVDVATLYTEPNLGVTTTGPLAARMNLQLSDGVVNPKTHVSIFSPAFRALRPPLEAQGALDLKLILDEPSSDPVVHATLSELTVATHNGAAKAPRIDRAATTMTLEPLDVTQPLKWKRIALSGAATVPDLSILEALLTTKRRHNFDGSARGSFEAALEANGKGQGAADVRLNSARWTAKDVDVRTEGRLLSRFELIPRSNPTAAKGVVSLDLAGADSLLNFAVGEPFKSMIAGALEVDRLSANIAIHATRNSIDAELTDARSGTAGARGYFHVTRGGMPQAAALLTASAIRFGLMLAEGELQISPLVSEDWLTNARKRLGRSVNVQR